jgi:hypothetical protein
MLIEEGALVTILAIRDDATTIEVGDYYSMPVHYWRDKVADRDLSAYSMYA